MQSPSSLIFLVLLGIWAAYFVQYWVRRRDHLATARSVEQFSAAMRVLERRDALSRTDLSEPAPRSYAVHPSRAARPQVLVERAVAAQPVAAPARPPGVVRRPRVRPSRRVRGVAFLVAVAALVVVAPLVVFFLLPVWALVPAFVAVGGALLWVRSGARAEQAMVRAHRRRLADLERRRTAAPVVAGRAPLPAQHPTPHRRPQPGPVAAPATAADGLAGAGTAGDAPGGSGHLEQGAVAEHSAGTAAERADRVAVEAETVADEVAASAAPGAPAPDVMVPIVDEDDIPLTWDPVPVPRPTYTMKAKAERREVAPAAVTPDPAPVARPDAGHDTAYDQRRVAGA